MKYFNRRIKTLNRYIMLKNRTMIILLLVTSITFSCETSDDRADAYGNFEVEETTISAQAAGELLEFNIEEGVALKSDTRVGVIDSTTLAIQKSEIFANIGSIKARRVSIDAEQKVLDAEMANLKREHNRVKLLIKSESATQKQLDDIEGNIVVLKSKSSSISSQYSIINAQVKVMLAKIDLIDEQISRCLIINPTNGLVLTKLARKNELVAPGRPLYKIADMSTIYLKAYIAEPQLAIIKQGQKVIVKVDYPEGQKEIEGLVSWVSSESEFTPKIIQTKEERVNLVYAIKVSVNNDGYLKLGMPGEVYF
jgi:HlyD family secretion protein